MSISNYDTAPSLGSRLKIEVFQKKLTSPWSIAVLILVAIGAGFLAANDLFLVPFIIAGALFGITILYYVFFKPLIGYYIITFISFFIFFPSHLVGRDLPGSTGIELLIFFLFLGTFLSVKTNAEKKSNLLKTAVSIALLCNILFFIIQAFNPNLPALTAWTPSFKRFIVYFLLYICAYRLIDTAEKFRYFVKFWIVFSFIAAAYGCFQQWFGYLPMEIRYIQSTPGEYDLLYQGGQLRKFSFLSDVVSFGILSGSMSIFTLIIAAHEKEKKRRYRLIFFAIIMILGMAYSGTRTTNILLPAGMVIYGFITIQNKATLTALFISVMIVMFIMFAPIYNPTIERIRSTFDSKEESLNLRDRNRHYIQPYIHAHPLGGGVGTSGVSGAQLFPTHPLAGFPPDSGLLTDALEIGWVGLAFTILFNMIILYQGIFYYFRMKKKEYKMFMVAILATLFPIIVAQYAQVTIGQIPGAIFYFSVLALMKRLKEFDEEGDEKLVVPAV